MSLSKKESLDITQAELNDEGLKTQLTQNDLLEVIVSERYQSLIKKVQDLKDIAQSILKERENIYEKFINKLKEKAVAYCGVKLSDVSNFYTNVEKETFTDEKGDSKHSSSISILVPTIRSEHRGSTTKEYIHPQSYSHVRLGAKKISGSWKLECKSLPHKKVEKAIVFTGKFADLDFLPKESKAFDKSVLEHNTEVQEFCDKYEGVNINQDALLKTVRTEFNKKLISGSAPKLKAKIKDIFLIDLA